MQPYIIVTKAFTLLSLSIGRPSTMSVSLLNISFIWTPSVLTLFKYSGNLYALWVPNTIFTYGNSLTLKLRPKTEYLKSGYVLNINGTEFTFDTKDYVNVFMN